MRKLITLSFITLASIGICSQSMAAPEFPRYDISSSSCKAQDTPLRVCNVNLLNGDNIAIQQNGHNQDVIVTSGSNNNASYFKPAGFEGKTKVTGTISVLFKKTPFGKVKRQALVYKRNYTDINGKKGYQIVLIRLHPKRTCEMAAFDSNTPNKAKKLGPKRFEASLRQKALDQAKYDDFHTAAVTCPETNISDDVKDASVGTVSMGDFSIPEDQEGDTSELAQP